MDAQGKVDYYLGDSLGSARVVANSSWTILDDCDFLPFGDEQCVASSSGNTFKFAGMKRDSESGLDHTLHRQYASNYGRWTSPDPLGGHLSDPQTLNKYVYAADNPTTLTDPTGLDLWLLCQTSGPGCHKAHWWSRRSYLGTWNADHTEFIRKHIPGDQRKIARLGPHGITVNGKYEGVWDTNKGEQNPVAVAGAGALSAFTFVARGSDFNDVQGNLYNNFGFDPAKLAGTPGTPASADAVRAALSAPGSGYVVDKFDLLHGLHTTNFRGHADSDPDLIPSTHVPVPRRGAVGFVHVDSTYPYDDVVDLAVHAASVVESAVPH